MKFDFAKILDVSKRYWVIIVFCLIMICAMIAIPVFVSGQQVALQKELDQRKKTNDDITQVLNKQRHQPVVTLSAEATAPPLEVFPNERVIAAGETAIKGLQAQSMQLKTDANQINAHTLLVPGSLPIPADPYQFRTVYLQQFDTAIPRLLVSATPPTEQEIASREEQETRDLTAKQPKNPQGEVYSKTVLDQSIADMMAKMPEKMRLDAANQHKMYMAPTALSIHPALAPTQSAATVVPDAEAIWLAQMGLWVQQGVVSSVARLNAASTRVETSPVKQLVQIYVAPDRSMYVLPGGANPGSSPQAVAAGASVVAANSETDPFPVDYAASPTGRVSNGVFDVVQFDIIMNVQAADVEKVIQEFERNRLLTVCQSEVQAVNSAAMRLEGYYFGHTPIVTLTLRCEELFMRDWTHTLMPDPIKKFLNVDQPAGAGGDAGATPGPTVPAPPMGRPQMRINH
jgi:hypothetical protein